MSDAEKRLIAAWSRLAKDVVAAVFSHHDTHAGGGFKLPKRFKVSPNIRCQPAATGIAGEVRVPVAVPAATGLVAPGAPKFHASPVTLLAYDPQQAKPAPPAATITPIPGTQAVLVSIGAAPVGTYVGFVMDESGAQVAPFVIYIDGL
jgi:hypothetical protein